MPAVASYIQEVEACLRHVADCEGEVCSGLRVLPACSRTMLASMTSVFADVALADRPALMHAHSMPPLLAALQHNARKTVLRTLWMFYCSTFVQTCR